MFFNWFQKQKVEVVESTGYLKIGEKTVSYQLRKKRCKWLRMSVNENGLSVTAPLRMAEGQIETHLMEKQQWIEKQLEFYKNSPRQWKELESGDKVKFLGEDCLVLVANSTSTRSTASLTSGVVNLKLGEGHDAKRVLKKWFVAQARKVIEERVDVYREKFGVSIPRISIKSQRTRWGSCSSRGNLNFNWKLAMAPVSVIDYLVVHELAHLNNFNHRQSFWNTVEMHCPGYKEKEKWLKDNGHLLNF